MAREVERVWVIRCARCGRLDPSCWWGSLDETGAAPGWVCAGCRGPGSLPEFVAIAWLDLQLLRGDLGDQM